MKAKGRLKMIDFLLKLRVTFTTESGETCRVTVRGDDKDCNNADF